MWGSTGSIMGPLNVLVFFGCRLHNAEMMYVCFPLDKTCCFSFVLFIKSLTTNEKTEKYVKIKKTTYFMTVSTVSWAAGIGRCRWCQSAAAQSLSCLSLSHAALGCCALGGSVSRMSPEWRGRDARCYIRVFLGCGLSQEAQRYCPWRRGGVAGQGGIFLDLILKGRFVLIQSTSCVTQVLFISTVLTQVARRIWLINSFGPQSKPWCGSV